MNEQGYLPQKEILGSAQYPMYLNFKMTFHKFAKGIGKSNVDHLPKVHRRLIILGVYDMLKTHPEIRKQIPDIGVMLRDIRDLGLANITDDEIDNLHLLRELKGIDLSQPVYN